MKPRLTIFKNERAGQPIKKNDGSFVEYDGKKILQPDLNGKINLPEGLAAGDYEVSIYKATAKSGVVYYSGNIKPAFKREAKSNQHQTSKQNGYQNKNEDPDYVPF